MSVNTIETAALLALLSAVLIVGSGALAGNNGMYFGFALAAVMNFSSYFFCNKIALMSYNAQPVSETRNHVGRALAFPRKCE
jgi:heat shock protein HtpX